LFCGEDKDEESSLVIFEAKVRAGVNICGGGRSSNIEYHFISEIMLAYLLYLCFRRDIIEFF